VAAALLDGSPLEEGQIIVCDKGFADRFLQARVAELGATLLRPDRKGEPARCGSLGPVRQWIESIIDTLKGQLPLEEHGGRTPAGVMVRVAAGCPAVAGARGRGLVELADRRPRKAFFGLHMTTEAPSDLSESVI